MEWDFKPIEVIEGKVSYLLEDFVRDLKVEVKHNFSDFDKHRLKSTFHLCYIICYLKAIELSNGEILKQVRINKNFLEMIVRANSENIDMLRAVLMRMVLENLERFGSFLPNNVNMELVNAKLRIFHEKHKL